MRAGVQGIGRRAVDGVARLVFVGDRGGRTGHQGSVGRAGDAAPLARQDGCHGRGGDQAVGRGRDGGVEGFAGRGRAIGARERDIDGGVGFFSRPGSARHGVGGRLRRRVQGPFQGRAGLRGAGRFAGLRVRHAARLPRVQIRACQPHDRRARGAGPRHPRGPRRFLHGRVRVPQDARPIVGAGSGSGRGRACAAAMDTGGLPPRAPEQAASWAASHGDAYGLVHHADHGVRYISTVCTTRVMEYGMLPSTGTVGDSYDNAMAESADGAYRTELVWRRKPFRDLAELELATFRWVSWQGLEASAPVLGLQDTGTDRNRVLCKPSGASRPTIRAEQKSGHIIMVKVREKI